MNRIALLLLLLFVSTGCWLFERTDDRPAPIVEASYAAAVAAQEAAQDAIIIPGIPNWIPAAGVGAVSGIAAFISVLVRRKQELDAKAKGATVPASPDGGAK